MGSKFNVIIKIVRLTLWLLPVLLFFWLINKNFIPSGKLSINYKISNKPTVTGMIKNFASKETDRLIGTNNKRINQEYFQLITSSPLYFDLQAPRAFRKATVTIKYQNPDGQPEIKIGVKQANNAYIYEDMAYYNPILNALPEYWDKIQEGNVSLWQKDKEYFDEKIKNGSIYLRRKEKLDQWKKDELDLLLLDFELNSEKYLSAAELIEGKYNNELTIINNETKTIKKNTPKYASIASFLSNLPEQNKIIQYNYGLIDYIQMPNYKISNKPLEIDNILRGPHEIYTYIGEGENIDFTFFFQDINRHSGEDKINISVYDNKNQKVRAFEYLDDGNNSSNGRASEESERQVFIKEQPFGIYRLVIDTTDDVFVKKIKTYQNLLMFKNHVFLADSREYLSILGDANPRHSVVFTNSSAVNFSTPHDDGFQLVDIFSRNKRFSTNIDEIKKVYFQSELTGVSRVVSPKNDINLEGNGFFSFSEQELFDVNYLKTGTLTDQTKVDDYDFIITDYKQAQESDGWLVASATIAGPQLYFQKENGYTASFIISLPGLSENYRNLKVKEVSLTLEKDPITFDNFFQKIKNKIINLKRK